MKKEELKKLRTLKATDTMMKIAGMDVPKLHHYGYGGRTCDSYKYGIYLRCQILSGILKVAFFLAHEMRNGINRPVYELFINQTDGEFITWDVIGQKWRNAKLDMLEWPEYVWHSGKYINPEGNRSIKRYLNVANGGYKGILEYQLGIRAAELKQRHRRETGVWDMTMEQIPEIPKGFKEWVDKKGMKQHYIFYEYSRKGAKEGYCTYCDKTVSINSPKHNSYGKCKCCGRDVQFKSRGKAGSFYTGDEHVYLLQKCEDGFVVRQFRARRHYYKGKYEYADKKYQIIVPDKIEDIIVEGRVLGHCLDRSDIYFERIQKKESYIVFLRKIEEPDTPYYTLEIEPGGAARQKRTTGDKQNKDFDDAKKFIKKWQQEIQQRLSADDMKLAEQSAVLRAEEFKELRASQTKIWRGHLAGKLLVDVLEADLMEVENAARRCG